MSEDAVRAAFAVQEGWCLRLGSPFTARLCAAFAAYLDRSTAIGRRVLDWPGEPDALHEAVALRIAGGLHALVRRGSVPGLARLYPPAPLPEAAALWAAIGEALDAEEAELGRWLDSPPQTNEIARSAVLMAGCLVVAARTALPISLEELGSSAGLNLILDRYAYRLGARICGLSSSPVRLSPAWSGPDPPDATVRIVARRGVDVAPLDVTAAADRERLVAYLWPDQGERIARTEAALSLASADPPPIDRGDASAWLEQRLARTAPERVARVVAHSIAFQYFPPATQNRVTAAIETAGAGATRTAPLAWLRFESDPEHGGRATLRLKLWPDGEERLLALSDGHARAVEWLG